MSEWIKSNEDISVGDVFVQQTSDECGSSCHLYRVMEKRGKTLVVLRPIRGETYIDESCDRTRSEAKVRPLPDAVIEDERFVLLTRAYIRKPENRTTLWPVKHRGEPSVNWQEILHRYEEHGAHCSGWYGEPEWERYEKQS